MYKRQAQAWGADNIFNDLYNELESDHALNSQWKKKLKVKRQKSRHTKAVITNELSLKLSQFWNSIANRLVTVGNDRYVINPYSFSPRYSSLEKEEDARRRPLINSNFVSLLTRTMLANSLEVISWLSFKPSCIGNNYQLAKNLHCWSLSVMSLTIVIAWYLVAAAVESPVILFGWCATFGQSRGSRASALWQGNCDVEFPECASSGRSRL